MNDKRDKFDELLGDKLSEMREMPSEGLFDRIEASLAALEAQPAVVVAPSKKVVPLWSRQWVRVSVAVAAAVALFVGVALFSEQNMPAEQMAEVVEMVQEETPGDQQSGDQQPQEPQSVTEYLAVMTPKSVAPQPQNNPAQMGVAAVDEVADNQNQPRSIEQNSQTVAEKSREEAVKSATAATKRAAKRKQRRSNAEIEEYWRAVLGEEEEVQQHKLFNLADVKLYATNLGFNHGHMQVNNLTNNEMLVSELAAEGSESVVLTTPLFMKAKKETTSKLKHYMPVSAGLNLSWRLNDWLSLESGLIYTNLYSESDNAGRISTYRHIQNLHYMGLPVAATFEFVRLGEWGLYAKAGTTLEVCFAARQKTFIDRQLTTDQKLATEGLQIALNAAAGANYHLWNGLGLFAEAGVAYWTATKPQPASYRTEHPLGFSLMAGLRFSFE